MCGLKFDLLGDAERIINLDPEITHGALQLRVPKQKLHCSQIAGLLVNLRWLRSAQRMRAICRAIEPGAVRHRWTMQRIAASTSVAFPANGLGTNIGPREH